MKCDVRVEDDVKAVFQKAVAEFGGVDVCVNNAGLAHDAPLLSGATSNWKEMLDVSHARRCPKGPLLATFLHFVGQCCWSVCLYTRVYETAQRKVKGWWTHNYYQWVSNCGYQLAVLLLS